MCERSVSAHAAFTIFVKAKFHCASWFEAGSKLVADRFEVGRRPASNQLRTSFVPASNQLRTSFEADSVMEFGRDLLARASSLLVS